MDREEILQTARHWALRALDAGRLGEAVAEFAGQCRLHNLSPPLHHAEITLGVLIAEGGDPNEVRTWLMKQT
jgi:hypothetical protein